MEGPSNILEIAITEEHLTVALHPHPDLTHADGPDLWLCVPTARQNKQNNHDEHYDIHSHTALCMLNKAFNEVLTQNLDYIFQAN